MTQSPGPGINSGSDNQPISTASIDFVEFPNLQYKKCTTHQVFLYFLSVYVARLGAVEQHSIPAIDDAL